MGLRFHCHQKRGTLEGLEYLFLWRMIMKRFWFLVMWVEIPIDLDIAALDDATQRKKNVVAIHPEDAVGQIYHLISGDVIISDLRVEYIGTAVQYFNTVDRLRQARKTDFIDDEYDIS